MNEELGLNVLSRIMDWTNEQAREEFQWLRFMARLKYDGYRDFQAGMRFIESLATWLQQFQRAERQTAYALVRSTLVYIGPSEMQHLVEQFYPRTVRDRLFRAIALDLGIPTHRMLAVAEAQAAFRRLKRKTLFMGLSDGARIDIVRHSSVGTLTNEQLVVATQIDKDKWQDLLEHLRDDLQDSTARFAIIYLLDDFMATGTSLLRFNRDKERWSGKLIKFKDSIEEAVSAPRTERVVEPDWQLCIHHYVGSAQAKQEIVAREAEARASIDGPNWARSVSFSFGTVLPDDLPIDFVSGRHDAFIELTRTYYDPMLRTSHTDVGGVEHLGLGYGACALPLVLDHNTPNNAVALLWAETEGSPRGNNGETPAMRPLFRRRQRHT